MSSDWAGFPALPRASLGAQDRDAGVELVAFNNIQWMQAAVAGLRALRGEVWMGIAFTGEDIRAVLTERGLPPPLHSNAWGALILDAIRTGVIERTGEIRQARLRSSHARNMIVYRWTTP